MQIGALFFGTFFEMFCNVIHVVRLTCLYSDLLASCMVIFYSLCDGVFVDNVS